MLPDTRDTIAAVATAPGVGAIGIVRLSGPDAVVVFERVFRASHDNGAQRHMHYGHVVDSSGEVIDEGLAWFARGPETYTGEDLAELHVHGGPQILSEVLQACVAAGCRVAQPGEFTRRAFLSGRMDLSRAEAVADLIGATTHAAARVARDQLDGALQARVSSMRDSAIEVLAHVEASVDYPEEPITPAGGSDLIETLDALRAECSRLAATFDTGRLLAEGARVVLAGRPNVGKSSLLNALVERSRAIVTAEPGTTRDVVEAQVDLGGIPVTWLDTAGVRALDEKGSLAEAEGIRRSHEAIESADLIVLVTDGSVALTDEDAQVEGVVLAHAETERIARVVNKCDLDVVDEREGLRVSAKTGAGLDALKAELTRRLTEGAPLEGVVLTRARHRDVVLRAADAFADASRAIGEEASPELPASDIRAALAALGEITGETTPEDVLDVVFSRFCIGK